MKRIRNEFFAETLEQTQAFARSFVKSLPQKATLLFFGQLGAGKTSFIQAAASEYGIDPFSVTSPTFPLLHIYEGTQKIYHFDLFRLEGPQEFISLGFCDFFVENALFFIEWPERLGSLEIPGPTYHVKLSHIEKGRLIEVFES